jgi:pyrroline-5-carboxylate reductase
MIVFAVKPMMMEAALFSCREVIPADALVVSVAAGITSDQIQSWLGAGRQRAIVRAMPNTPTAVGQGACGICSGSNGLAGAEHLARVERLFSAAGVVHTVKESQMDAVTGLSGSGPAFICLVIEALADGGVAAGLPRPVALSLATQLVRRLVTTAESRDALARCLPHVFRILNSSSVQVKGTATLVQETGQHPGVLKDSVTSPGGTTIAGIHSLEKAGLRGALMSAVVAATKRAAELSAAAAPEPLMR